MGFGSISMRLLCSRISLSSVRFSLSCFFIFFSRMPSSDWNTLVALAWVETFNFVPPPASSKVYEVCECSGPESDLNPYFLFGSYSVTSKLPSISTAHEMADAAKKSSHADAACRNLGGFQSPVLPLKIVFRYADEIEDLFDGPVDELV